MALAEEEEEEGEKRGSSGADSRSLPLSPSWRRSPSYEQLQQIELDPQRLLQSHNKESQGTPPHLTGPDKRALTLSVSGSEAESVYGMPLAKVGHSVILCNPYPVFGGTIDFHDVLYRV